MSLESSWTQTKMAVYCPRKTNAALISIMPFSWWAMEPWMVTLRKHFFELNIYLPISYSPLRVVIYLKFMSRCRLLESEEFLGCRLGTGRLCAHWEKWSWRVRCLDWRYKCTFSTKHVLLALFVAILHNFIYLLSCVSYSDRFVGYSLETYFTKRNLS